VSTKKKDPIIEETNKGTEKSEEKEINTMDEVLKNEDLLDDTINLENEGEIDVLDIDPLKVLQDEIDQMNDRYLRLSAEYQNYRKRVEKEKSEIFKFANEKLLVEMLPIMDNFERALSMVDCSDEDNKVLDGINMIKKSLDDFFNKNGIKKMDVMGENFDPDKHHAVLSEEKEGCDSDIVIDVLQAGYDLNNKIIRPAMVKVSK